MTDLKARISLFLRTCVSPMPDRDAVCNVAGWFALRSHPGLVRTENDDRVVVAKWGERGDPCWVVAIADGIGSGKVGAEAASMTLAATVAALFDGPHGMEQRLAFAVELANRAVFERWRGKEGATLSAVVVRGQRPTLVNVGDSRIYGIDSDGNTVLLTRDDTLPTIPGLLQFVGMGTDLVPHVHQVAPQFSRVLLTSDGAHNYVEPLFQHLVRAVKGDMRMFIDRVIHIATWCGGGDNATAALASLAGPGDESMPSVIIDAWTPGTHHCLSDETLPQRANTSRHDARRPRREFPVPPRRNQYSGKARPEDVAQQDVVILMTGDEASALTPAADDRGGSRDAGIPSGGSQEQPSISQPLPHPEEQKDVTASNIVPSEADHERPAVQTQPVPAVDPKGDRH